MGIQTQSSVNSNDENYKDVQIPENYLLLIAEALHNGDFNTTGDINRPILKGSIRSFYWIFIIQYAVLAILGIISNIAIIIYTLYYKLFKDITHAFIINLGICHVVQCAIVLPITLMVMLIQNWIFGQFLCFFLPMLQDIPLHVAMISHLLIAWDRMRWLGDPLKGRLPTFVCCCASWLTGMVIALPYPIYTLYIELGDYVPRLQGIGLCVVNLMDDMHEYMRGLFVIMYCGPSILLSYLYIRTSQELRPPDGPFAVMMFEHRAELRSRQRNSSMTSGGRPRADSNRSYDLYSAELDVSCEKRTQRILGSMAATQVLCVCPLMILKLARMVVVETYENSKHFDFTYLMFVWIAFLPTVIFPCIYASEILPGTEKERLRGYFRLSSKRRLNKSQNFQEDSSIEQETTTTAIEIPTINNNNNNNNKNHAKKETCKTSALTENHTLNTIGRQKQQSDKIKSTSHSQQADTSLQSVPSVRDKRNARPAPAKDLHKSQQSIRSKTNSQSNSTSNSTKATGSARNENENLPSPSGERLFPPRKSLATDSLNNSCSNITSSTYCNVSNSIAGSAAIQDRNDSIRTSEGSGSGILRTKRGSTDYDTDSLISGSDTKTSLYGGVYDRKWNGVNPIVASLLAKNRDMSFDCSSHISYRSQGSSSTLDRDLEIIDLLERERSMDIQDMMERERRGELVRNYSITSERRRLPDLEKIKCKSPKIIESTLQNQYSIYGSNSVDSGCMPTPPISAGTANNQFEYPNATAGYFTNHYHQLLPSSRRPGSRRSSNSSSRFQLPTPGGGSIKRDSLTSIQGSGMGLISTSPIIPILSKDEDIVSMNSSNFVSDDISETDIDVNCDGGIIGNSSGKVSVIERTNSNGNKLNKPRAHIQRSITPSSSIRSSSIKSNRLIRNSIQNSSTPIGTSSTTTSTTTSVKVPSTISGQSHYDSSDIVDKFDRKPFRSAISETNSKLVNPIRPPLNFEQNIYAQL
ncbi:probable serine/threonine-protein kinase nek3 [Condylostylus longicornis]|uniref:probable serine/threonine-protein kinase nek3 n=1 Tax=Condylostylus longicornis TaxID=2530218 RepID=UPI00244DB313|nr:probable serine/threonine-protein kinase nek3 [Condylostylus longicornis]